MKGSPGEGEVNVSFGVHKCVSGGGESIDIKREIPELTGLLKKFVGATPEVHCALIST